MQNNRWLSVERANAEWVTGLPGLGVVHVRLLDNVSLGVHGGELLVVRDRDAIAGAMLFRALADPDAPNTQRYLRVTRRLEPGVQIRRAAIHSAWVQAIVDGWRVAGRDDARPIGTRAAKTLYLLRASRTGPTSPRDFDEWQRWAGRSRARGDGVVIACPAALLSGAITPLASARESFGTTAVREQSPKGTPSDAVRYAEIRAGRLAFERSPRRYGQESKPMPIGRPESRSSWGDSDGLQPPNAFGPKSKASLEP